MTRVQDFKVRLSDFAGAKVFKRSALNIRDGAGVFEEVLGAGHYRRILEIGTYRGVTAAYMATFPVDKVMTIDLVDGKIDKDLQQYDRRSIWDAMGVGDKIEGFLVKDNAEKAKLISGLDFDFAFVDGDHSAGGVATDFHMVKRCGAVLFHDYEPGTPVARFVDGLPREDVTVMDLFAFWRSSSAPI
jgi:predicted O-methyltransferase YrrM